MRVISGLYKSIKLSTLEGMTTRPTTDKVKENLFNMISCEDKIVLDLFGGSGGLGIEALSRGALHATFIDGSAKAIKIIHENVKKCDIPSSKCDIYRNDFLRALKIFSKKETKFDIVFLDPPYKKGLIDIALSNLVSLNLLNDNSIIICEYPIDDTINYDKNIFNIYKEKKYGSIVINILEYVENANE